MFKNLITRIQIDWKEWINYKTSMWNTKRDSRMIRRATSRAKEKNSEDGRTYYGLRDVFGDVNEFNSDDIAFWTSRGVLPKMDYLKRLRSSFFLVTSNPKVLDQYSQIQNKKETLNN